MSQFFLSHRRALMYIRLEFIIARSMDSHQSGCIASLCSCILSSTLSSSSVVIHMHACSTRSAQDTVQTARNLAPARYRALAMNDHFNALARQQRSELI